VLGLAVPLSPARGGYTAPTPAADGERVYVVFGSSVSAALDYEGKHLWRKEITLWWCKTAGDTASPVYANGVVYCD
jgi:hypothetical protein